MVYTLEMEVKCFQMENGRRKGTLDSDGPSAKRCLPLEGLRGILSSRNPGRRKTESRLQPKSVPAGAQGDRDKNKTGRDEGQRTPRVRLRSFLDP
jgi:hypothetical protein